MTKADRIKRIIDRDLWQCTDSGHRPFPRRKMMMWWAGRWPDIGDYLRCDSPRARKAYRIVEIPDGLSETEYRPITVEVRLIKQIPEGATVHLFQRDRRRRPRS